MPRRDRVFRKRSKAYPQNKILRSVGTPRASFRERAAHGRANWTNVGKLFLWNNLIEVAGAGHGPGMPGAINPLDLISEIAAWFHTHLGA